MLCDVLLSFRGAQCGYMQSEIETNLKLGNLQFCAPIVCYTAVFSVVTQRSSLVRSVA